MTTHHTAVLNPGQRSATGPAVERAASAFGQELAGWHAFAYRCFMVLMWIALASFFGLVLYNTLFVTASPFSGTPVYTYPTPGA